MSLLGSEAGSCGILLYRMMGYDSWIPPSLDENEVPRLGYVIVGDTEYDPARMTTKAILGVINRHMYKYSIRVRRNLQRVIPYFTYCSMEARGYFYIVLA